MTEEPLRSAWSRSPIRLHLAPELLRLWPAFLVVALLACVLVPLPTALVDLLLSLSLGISVLLLVAALRVERVSQLTVFPALVLLATLYRLALNVSTTRLILSQADAGRVVDAFAHLVVRSDLIIGAVIFAIVTLVQYLVIARGAERVAEVTARFALDALPGQQSSIDADLRNGAISNRQASEQRTELLERSMFHGAMDGAIRFVRHDAVAGLCITTINLLGGIAVGITRFDLTVGESLETFGRLTIGDGLLSQIPALLVGLAASVLVARVDRHAPVRWLHPAMLLVPASLLLVLAVIPGMPSAAFSVAALGMLAAAAWSVKRAPPEPAPELEQIEFSICTDSFPNSARLQRGLVELRDRCQRALGIELPAFALNQVSSRDHVDIHHAGVRIARLEVTPKPLDDSQLWLNGFRAIVAYAPELIDLQFIEERIEDVARTKPAIAREAMLLVDRPQLLALCRGLLRERVSLPSMTRLLHIVATDPSFRDSSGPRRRVEATRVADAKRWLPALFDDSALNEAGGWRRPTPDFEQVVRDAQDQTADELRITATDGEQRQWRERLIHTPGEPGSVRAIVTTARARPAFAVLLRDTFPQVPVISASELRAAGFTPLPAIWIDTT